MGTWLIRLREIKHRNCGHLREIGYRFSSMGWWCRRRLSRESPGVGAGFKPAPTVAFMLGGGQFFVHERLAGAKLVPNK